MENQRPVGYLPYATVIQSIHSEDLQQQEWINSILTVEIASQVHVISLNSIYSSYVE